MCNTVDYVMYSQHRSVILPKQQVKLGAENWDITESKILQIGTVATHLHTCVFSFALITRYVRKLWADLSATATDALLRALRSNNRAHLHLPQCRSPTESRAKRTQHRYCNTAVRGRLTRDDKRNPTAAGYEGPQRAERRAAEIPAGQRAASSRGDGGAAAPLSAPPPAGPVTCSSSARRSSSCPRRPCAPWRT